MAWLHRDRIGALALILASSSVFPGTAYGQQPAPVPPLPPEAAPTAPAEVRYVLNPGDVIEVELPFNPELNERLTIRPDGMISMPYAGEVRAAGLSPSELSQTLTRGFAQSLRQPDATVIVREFSAQRAYVGGEVGAPSVVELRGYTTVLQAVMQTGGIRSTASARSALLIRRGPAGAPEVRKLNLGRMLRGKAPDVPLQPFDIVFVPRSAIAQVGLFVEQYLNNLVPRALVFPYNLNTQVVVQSER